MERSAQLRRRVNDEIEVLVEGFASLTQDALLEDAAEDLSIGSARKRLSTQVSAEKMGLAGQQLTRLVSELLRHKLVRNPEANNRQVKSEEGALREKGAVISEAMRLLESQLAESMAEIQAHLSASCVNRYDRS
eukprot:TRINITY_DN2963_c0_g1_i2.p3 TRINITY_DN2963_c0_g1~~TRINITY_DN2963_c0_g1_i2.p3  ORF type:complete len:134 (+),score=41.83 TRINITY_DN2963_c0_g1_i2:206-607(+)